MRMSCLVLFVAVALLVPEAEGWRIRRTFRSIGRGIRRAVRKVGDIAKGAVQGAIKGAKGRRDIEAMDVNKDGLIDQSELENYLVEEREARELLAMVDENGDSAVTAEEFERGLREIAAMDDDEIDALEEEEYRQY